MNEANLDSRLTAYWRQAGEIVRTIYNTVSLKDVCGEIVDFHTRRANYYLEMLRRMGEKRELIDVSGSGKDLIEIGNVVNKDYLFDKDGIVVGIVEDNFYYPIEPNEDVKTTKKYINLERNPFLRLMSYPQISLYYLLPFQIKKFIDKIGRTIVGGAILLAVNNTRKGGKGEQEDSGNVSRLEQRI